MTEGRRKATGAEVRLLLWSVLFAATMLATVAIAGAALSKFARDGDGAGGDFLSIYAAARVVETGGGEALYNLDIQRFVQGEYRPSFKEDGEYNPYVLAPVVAWTVAPLAKIDFKPAFAVWAIANLALLGVVMTLLWRVTEEAPRSLRVTLIIAFGCSIPVIANAIFGQVDLFVVAALLLGFIFMRDERPIAAGAALALGVVKPHLLLGVILLLLMRRQWRALGSLAAVGGAIVVIPALLTGPGVLEDYARALFAFPGSGTAAAVNVDTMPNLRGLVAGITGETGALYWLPLHSFIAAFAIGAAMFAFEGEGRISERAWAIAVLLPLVVSPHLHTQSLMLLFVALALWLGEQRRKPELAQRLDAISGMLALDVVLFGAWVAATLGVPLGGLIVGGALVLALMRWSEKSAVAQRLDVKRRLDTLEAPSLRSSTHPGPASTSAGAQKLHTNDDEPPQLHRSPGIVIARPLRSRGSARPQ